MNGLGFRVTGARAEPYAAVPTLMFELQVEGGAVESIALRCQVRIEPAKRRYTSVEEAHLNELFGETPRWGETLHPFLWTHIATVVPSFNGVTKVELAVPVSYDLEVAAAKYFHGLEGGEVPLIFLFSGTLFVRGPTGGLHVQQVPWDKEASFRLPVATWRQVMDLYFPNSGWLRLRRDTLDSLLAAKARRAVATFDELLAALLRDAGEEAPS